MADKIRTADFIENDGTIGKIIAELNQLKQTYKELVTEIRTDAGKVEKSMNSVTGSIEQQTDAAVSNAKQVDKLEKAYDKYVESLNETEQEIAKVREAQKVLNQVHRLEAKEALNKEGSYNKLSAQYSLLKIRLNQLSAEERKFTKEGRDLVKQAKATREEMKRLQEETGETGLNVGNYKESIKEAIGELGGFESALGSAGGGVGEFAGRLANLAKNPITVFFGLVAAGVVGMIKAFAQSETGANLLNRASGALAGVWSTLVGAASDVGNGIIQAFSNEKKRPIEIIGEALKTAVLNRLQAIPKLLGFISIGFQALGRGDIPTLKKAAEGATKSLIQFGTSLDFEDQKKLSEGVAELTEEAVKNAKAFADLYEARVAVSKVNRSLSKGLEDLTTKEELLNQLAGDGTRSFQELREANEGANKAAQERAKVEQQIIRNNLSLINREIDLRRANKENIQGLLDEQLNLYRQLRGAERDYTLAVAKNEQERRQIKQDELERDLDFLLDVYDNQKTINERRLKDETLSFEQRKKILQKTRDLGNKAFTEQIETIQKFTDVQINANELIQESDARTVNQKVRALGLSEIIEGRILEAIRDRKTELQDLTEAEQELGVAEKARAKELGEILKQGAIKRRDLELKTFDEQAALEKAQFEETKRTEAEKTKFQLEAEKSRLLKVIELNKQYGGLLSDLQIEAAKSQITRIERELGEVQEGKDLFSLLGLNVTDKQKQAFKDAFEFAKDQLTDYFKKRVEFSKEAVDQSNEELAAAQRFLDAEIQNRNAGFAHKVETAQKEVNEAKANQKKALQEQEKAAQAQQRIETIQQASSLITASAKIWSELGFPLALAGIGVMFGSFLYAKIKASQLTKRRFGRGGYEELKGGGHDSGNDIPIYRQNGEEGRAQGGEGLAVFSRKAVRQYGKQIPRLVEAINRGSFSDSVAMSTAQMMVVNQVGDTGPDPGVKSELVKIRKQGAQREYIDSQGRRVVVRGANRIRYKA